MKFRNDIIESVKHTNKSKDKIINNQESIFSYNKSLLKKTLNYFSTLFDRSLGTYKCNMVLLKLKSNVLLKYHKPYPILLKYCKNVKEKVNRLEKLDIIE